MRLVWLRLFVTFVLGGMAAAAVAGCASQSTGAEEAPLAAKGDAAQAAATAAPSAVTADGGAAEAGATMLARSEAGEPVIVFKRGGGLAGRSDEWLIYADGTVQAADGTRKTVAPEEVAALLAGLEARGFFELQAAYGRDSQCADCYQYELTVVHDGQKKTVTTVDSAPDAPPELGLAIQQIQALVGG
jgi:hypothetical protein